jgi:hypothetical protein
MRGQRKVSYEQASPWKPEPNPVERVALMLDGDAEFLEQFAAAQRRKAELLRQTLRMENRDE